MICELEKEREFFLFLFCFVKCIWEVFGDLLFLFIRKIL